MNIINKLSKYSLTKNNINELIKNEFTIRYNENINHNDKINNNSKLNNNINSNKNDKTILIKENDKLFWYLYMIINNLSLETLPMKNERFSIESDFKLKTTELLLKTKELQWKSLKIKKCNVITSISNSVSKTITKEDMIAFIYLYKINIIYIWNKCYIKLFSNIDEINNSNNINIIINEDNLDKLVLNEYNDEYLKKISNNYIEVFDILKPLKSLSSYKLNELQDMAKQLHIILNSLSGKSLTKQELYEKLQKQMM